MKNDIYTKFLGLKRKKLILLTRLLSMNKLRTMIITQIITLISDVTDNYKKKCI